MPESVSVANNNNTEAVFENQDIQFTNVTQMEPNNFVEGAISVENCSVDRISEEGYGCNDELCFADEMLIEGINELESMKECPVTPNQGKNGDKFNI